MIVRSLNLTYKLPIKSGLRTVGYACDDITVEDIETGMTSVIFGANKSKLTSNSQLVT